jgi:hypothetical protein
MNSLNLIRAGGVAAILAGLFYAAQGIPSIFDQNTANFDSLADYLVEATFGMSRVALLIVFVALLQVHTEQGTQGYGRLGRVGFFAAFVGSLLVIVKELLILGGGAAFGAQAVLNIEVVLGVLYGAGDLLLMLGLVLLGIATLRARVLPRWFGSALILVWFVGTAFQGNGPNVELPFWIAIGYGLWSHARTRQPVRAQSAAIS